MKNRAGGAICSPKLQALYGSGKTVWILGIIWAVWHYPFTIFETLSNMVDVPVGPMVITLVMALAGQTMSLIGMTYLYVWIYNHTAECVVGDIVSCAQ